MRTRRFAGIIFIVRVVVLLSKWVWVDSVEEQTAPFLSDIIPFYLFTLPPPC